MTSQQRSREVLENVFFVTWQQQVFNIALSMHLENGFGHYCTKYTSGGHRASWIISTTGSVGNFTYHTNITDVSSDGAKKKIANNWQK